MAHGARPSFIIPRTGQRDPGAGGEFRTLAEFVGKISEDINRKLELKAKLLGAERGRDAGLEGTFSKREQLGTFSQAFNAAGMQAAAAKAKVEIENAVATLAVKNALDSAGFAGAAEKFRTELAAGTPAAVRKSALFEFDQQVLTAAGRIQANEVKQARAGQKAAIMVAANRARDAALQLAATGGGKSPATQGLFLQDLAVARQEYLAFLSAGRQFGITPREMVDEVSSFDRELVQAAMKGDFRREIESGRGMAALNEFRETRATQTRLTLDEFDAMEKFMERRIGRHLSELAESDAARERGFKLPRAKRFRDMFELASSGIDISAMLDEEADRRLLTSGQWQTLFELNEDRLQQGRDNPVVVELLVEEVADQSLSTERLLEFRRAGELRLDTFLTFKKQVSANERGDSPLRTAEYKAVLSEVLSALGFDPGGFQISGLLKPNEARQVSEARRLLRKMVVEDGLSPDNAGPLVIEALRTRKQASAKPTVQARYNSAEEIFAANQRGDFGGSAALFQFHLAIRKRWDDYNAARGKQVPKRPVQEQK